MGEGSPVRMTVHGGPVGSHEIPTQGRPAREARLAIACRELEMVLEATDLEAEPAFADALVEAIGATDRVYEMARTPGESADDPADARDDTDDAVREEEPSTERQSEDVPVPSA